MSIEEIFHQTAIWNHFDSVANDSQREHVKKLVKYSIPILDRIIETFPTYTLHNGQHQLNILNLYSKLLGARIADLTSLESAILILSAFYHDIGMVFKDDEKQKLQTEELFAEFLSENPSARLLLEKNDKLDSDLAEWYCRWSHAKRVWIYLDQVNELLIWEDNNFRKELAHVCLSHNENAKYIASEKVASNYWNNADLKFCAILLRLADILDFDKSRTPESVYSYLGLSSPKSSSAETSYKEWNKHLASSGFYFDSWSANTPYTIYFKATPNHPAVENDIREFLDVIENEIQQCRIVLRACSNRWRNFILPEKIDKTYIYSQGYTSGSFKFSLDQKQVLHLLMGESLYENSFVFVRELLQNAIDTTRYREKHEKYVAKSSYSLKEIEFSTWHDSSGFKWVRVDDFGMGMTIDQIEKYFLKIGTSFYNSQEFEASKINYPKEDRKFTPVSKFGIGILSCFLVADLIEISTRSVYCDSERLHPVRLSLQGIDNYYFLYTDNDIPKEMPHHIKNESGYRKEIGTSISIRINPNFDRTEFEINNLLQNLVYSSFVPIKYKANVYGTERIADLPEKNKLYKIAAKDISSIRKVLRNPKIKEINTEIQMISVKLDDEKVPDVKGMLYVFLLRKNITYFTGINNRDGENFNWQANDDENIQWSFHYSTYDKGQAPEFSLRLENRFDDKRQLDIPLGELLNVLDEFNGQRKYQNIRNEILLTHNGIIIPNNPGFFVNGTKLEISLTENDSDASICLGIINLKDDLRPNLNVARDKIISFPWSCFSQVNFLIRSSLDKSKYEFEPQINYLSYHANIQVDYKDIDIDNLLNSKEGWPTIVEVDKKGSTIKSLIDGEFAETEILDRHSSGLSALIEKKIIFNHCNYSIRLFKVRVSHASMDGNQFQLQKKAYVSNKKQYDVKPFPAYYVCEYENFTGLMPMELNSQLYNIHHPFTKWLISSYSHLSNKFPFYLRSILAAKSVEDLNLILDKLVKLLPDELLPKFSLSKRDFEVDFDSLEEKLLIKPR